jgi:hypothetical protein
VNKPICHGLSETERRGSACQLGHIALENQEAKPSRLLILTSESNMVSSRHERDREGLSMKKDRIVTGEPVELDPSELLGFSQVAKVSGGQGKPAELGRLLSKIGLEGETSGGPLGRLLSKIGDGELPQ